MNRWKLLAIDSPTEAAVRRVDERLEEFALQIDQASKTLTLTRQRDGVSSTFTYEQPSPEELLLTGDRGRGPVRLKWTSDLPR